MCIALKSYPFLRKPVGLSTNRDDVAYFFLLAFAFLVLINCTTNFNVQTRKPVPQNHRFYCAELARQAIGSS